MQGHVNAGAGRAQLTEFTIENHLSAVAWFSVPVENRRVRFTWKARESKEKMFKGIRQLPKLIQKHFFN